MVNNAIFGWIFGTDSIDGIPYLQCPHCSRKVSGLDVIFASAEFTTCPSCEKPLHMNNLTEEDWLYMRQYFGNE